MQPHMQLEVVLTGEYLAAYSALPVLLGADALVHVVPQLGEDEEGLVAVGAQESLGQVGPGMRAQPW